MPFNGAGVYSSPALPGSFNPAVSGSPASPADWNTWRQDIEAALTTAICKDGQTTVTANLPMATYRHTGVGNPTATNQYATVADIQASAYSSAAADTGAANAYIIAPTIPITAYAVYQVFTFIPGNTNTTASTLAVSGLPAKSILRVGSGTLAANDILAGGLSMVMYDGTQFQLLTNGFSAGSANTLTNKTYDTAGTGNSLLINGVAVTANSGTGAVARVASPTFTGAPLAPTAAAGTNTTQLASTAFANAVAGLTPTAYTPSDQSGAGLSFSAVSAQWVKIGNTVFAYGTLTFPATGSGLGASISLPVAVPNQEYAAVPGSLYVGSGGGPGTSSTIMPVKNTSAAQLFNSFVNSGAQLANSAFSGATIRFALAYPAA